MSEVLMLIAPWPSGYIFDSLSWKLDRHRARSCLYVVCVQRSDRKLKGDVFERPFRIGRIKDVEQSDENGDNTKVTISHYADLDGISVSLRKSDIVRYYSSLDDLGINEKSLEWQAVRTEGGKKAALLSVEQVENGAFDALARKISSGRHVIKQAKSFVAEYFNVEEEAIEITIKLFQ